MRRISKGVLLLFIFAIPWEYSLDWGEPVGNIARVMGLCVMLTATFALLCSNGPRAPGPMQCLVLAYFLWFCCTCFWTIDTQATLDKLRGLAQELMIVWLVWEFVETPSDLRMALRAFVAGSAVLAVLSLANYGTIDASPTGLSRLAAEGQDPNDMARYLCLGLPVAAVLLKIESHWPWRALALSFLPLGAVVVLLTASRSGFLAEATALAGCAWLLARSHKRLVLGACAVTPLMLAALWLLVPHDIFIRLGSIPEQLQGGDLNQRWNIWMAGWDAFVHAPILGSGAGTFVSAAALSPIDTAHNTLLSIAVNGGLCALLPAGGLVIVAIGYVARMERALLVGMAISLLVLGLTSLVATVEDSRETWLVLALIAVAGRFGEEGQTFSVTTNPPQSASFAPNTSLDPAPISVE
jgi:O-antigen ligase